MKKENNDPITRAVRFTVDAIGLNIRRANLVYDDIKATADIFARRQYMHSLEGIIDKEFTLLAQFLKFKQYSIYTFNISKVCNCQDQETVAKSCNDSYGKASISVLFVYGKDLHNLTRVDYTYDWINNLDVHHIKPYSSTEYVVTSLREQ